MHCSGHKRLFCVNACVITLQQVCFDRLICYLLWSLAWRTRKSIWTHHLQKKLILPNGNVQMWNTTESTLHVNTYLSAVSRKHESRRCRHVSHYFVTWSLCSFFAIGGRLRSVFWSATVDCFSWMSLTSIQEKCLLTTTCRHSLTDPSSPAGQCKIRSTPFPKAITVRYSK